MFYVNRNFTDIFLQDLMPLVVMFELPITGCFQAFPDVESPFIQNLQSRYSVQVSFRARSRGPRPGVVVIKGSETDVVPLKEAVKILVDYFCGTLAVSDLLKNYGAIINSFFLLTESSSSLYDARDFPPASRCCPRWQQNEFTAYSHCDGNNYYVS